MGTHGRGRGERDGYQKCHGRRGETGGGDPEPFGGSRGNMDSAAGDGFEVRRAGDEARVDIRHDRGGHRHGVRHHVRGVLQLLWGVQTRKRQHRGRPKPVAAAEHRQSPRYDGDQPQHR